MTDEQKRWHREECAQFKTELPDWDIYAGTLKKVLEAVCRLYAPLGIVQSRTKALSSFAEKIARKAGNYMTKGTMPTDLCGARIITETQSEVDKISEAIRSLFTIEEENSLDVRTRLQASEFGYLSLHFVVLLPAQDILGIPVPPKIGSRKAEIQVRTFLQHAWASISHYRVYKSSFQVPLHLNRELARVAALLEEADGQFGRCVETIDAYKLHYGAWMNEARIGEEIGVLETVLESEPDESRRPATALRLARVAGARSDWNHLLSVLDPFLAKAGRYRLEVLAEHGNALCRKYSDTPRDPLFLQGRKEIEEAVSGARGDLRIRVLSYRAWASARIPDNEEEARTFYREACEADPANPFPLSSYVEYEIYCGEPFGFRAVMKPVLSGAIATCRAYADAGIELPWVFLTMGRFHLLLDEPMESLAAYSKAVQMCLTESQALLEPAIDAELLFLRRLNRARAIPEAHLWVRDLLLLARAVGLRKESSVPAKRTTFLSPVVVLAGGTAPGVDEKIAGVRQNLLRAFEGFDGAIVAGGTTAGIAGIAGEISAHLKAAGSPAETVGYRPGSMPVSEVSDPRYSTLIATEGHGFSPREPLQYWADFLASGVKPGDVKVLGADGGRISALEYMMALAFGATVAIVEPPSGSASVLCQDPEWKMNRGLIRLPNDAMTLRAFVNPPRTTVPAEEVESRGATDSRTVPLCESI